MRKGPWPKTGEGSCVWFTDSGVGPSEIHWEVYAAISVPEMEHVGLYFAGLGGPYMDPDTADAIAAALTKAAARARAEALEGTEGTE